MATHANYGHNCTNFCNFTLKAIRSGNDARPMYCTCKNQIRNTIVITNYFSHCISNQASISQFCWWPFFAGKTQKSRFRGTTLGFPRTRMISWESPYFLAIFWAWRELVCHMFWNVQILVLLLWINLTSRRRVLLPFLLKICVLRLRRRSKRRVVTIVIVSSRSSSP